MASSRETTPLLGRRRRSAGQDDSSFQEYSDEESVPVNANVDPSKADRRPWLARVVSSCHAGLRGTARPLFSPISSPDPENGAPQYYIDDFNEFSWRCKFGTREGDGIWLNFLDKAGTLMGALVWLLIVYSGVTVTFLCQQHHFNVVLGIFYNTICGLALASHAKTTFTDPGSIPQSAVPLQSTTNITTQHMMCKHCQSYKPPFSHHCRICNRCISRMDHHCPWMNNCIGAGNLKHFILFLCYTWVGSAFALLLFAWNYFGCRTEDCMFSLVLMQLVRAMTVICICALLFTSSMLMAVTYGVMTGITTIDRLKKKATGTTDLSTEEPMELVDIFGIGPYWTWALPIDPVFPNFDKVMCFSTPQRILREQMQGVEDSESLETNSMAAYSKASI